MSMVNCGGLTLVSSYFFEFEWGKDACNGSHPERIYTGSYETKTFVLVSEGWKTSYDAELIHSLQICSTVSVPLDEIPARCDRRSVPKIVLRKMRSTSTLGLQLFFVSGRKNIVKSMALSLATIKFESKRGQEQ